MPVIVMLHALGSSQRAWQPQVAGLADRYRVLTPDLPGHGATRGPFTFDRAVLAIREMIAAETEPVHLTAISGAVSVALLTSLAEPDRVASLLLSGGVARAASGDALQRTVMTLLPQSVIVNMLKGMYSGGRSDYLDTAVEDLGRAGKATILAGLREIAGVDLRPRLAEIRVPTLVVCGDRDKANIAPAKELAAGIPGAELRQIPGAGHIWNLEQPDLFSRTVSEFVDHAAS